MDQSTFSIEGSYVAKHKSFLGTIITIYLGKFFEVLLCSMAYKESLFKIA
jgi:hypothetical protein